MIAALVLLVVALSGANWMLAPETGIRSIRGAVMLTTLWGGLRMWQWMRLRSMVRAGVTERNAVKAYGDRAIVWMVGTLGGYMIVGDSLQLWIALGGAVDPDLRRRFLGLTASAVLFVLGNGLPKILTPLCMLPPGGAARIQTARRNLGLVLVALSVVMAGAFIFGTLEWAIHVRRWSAITSVLALLVAIVWMNVVPTGEEDGHEQGV